MNVSIREWGRIFMVLSIALGLADALNGQPVADYGDAPDPMYPSYYANQGPYHLDTTQEWLGPRTDFSTTTLEAVSVQVDNDYDDGVTWIVPGPLSDYFLATRVSINPTASSPSDNRYLNAMLDINHDGRWDANQGEWILQNAEVDFAELPTGVDSATFLFQLQPEAQDSMRGASLSQSYLRTTLTTEQIPVTPENFSGAWGEQVRGETEDLKLGESTDPSNPGLTGDPQVPLIPKVRQELDRDDMHLPTEKRYLTPVGTCNVCGAVGHLAPVGGIPAPLLEIILDLPPNTTEFNFTYNTQVGCQNTLMPNSFVAYPGGATFVDVASQNIIPGLPGGVPDKLTLTLNGALVQNLGHGEGWLEYNYRYLVDPQGEWVVVNGYGYTSIDEFVVPAPGAFGAGLVLLAGLGLRRFRLKT